MIAQNLTFIFKLQKILIYKVRSIINTLLILGSKNIGRRLCFAANHQQINKGLQLDILA